MHFASITGLVSFAALTAANTISSPSDLDGSVWEGLSSINERQVFTPQSRNRPAKRQSGWSPPSELTTPLKQVWDHCLKTYSNGNLYGFKNYGWDQIMSTKGKINVCVRWDSSASITEAQRAKVATTVNAQYQKWFKWVYGFDNFPFSNVEVKVVGWAVRDKALLQGSTSGLDIYTNKDAEGIPECAPVCGRMFNQNDLSYKNCPGGADRHYDQSLWLTDGLGGGFGGDWGQRIGREYFMNAIDSANIHILLHEMGHTFGLDDFYDWTPSGITNFIMLAGSAAQITDFDGWMLRNWWYELSRNRGWQSGSGSGSGNTSPATSAKPPTAVTTTKAPAVATSAPPQTTAKTTAKVTKTAAEVPPVQTSGSGSGAAAGRWQQCGGAGYTGATRCETGLTCTKQNDYYSQCL